MGTLDDVHYCTRMGAPAACGLNMRQAGAHYRTRQDDGVTCPECRATFEVPVAVQVDGL